jgi:hypothetical protein
VEDPAQNSPEVRQIKDWAADHISQLKIINDKLADGIPLLIKIKQKVIGRNSMLIRRALLI